MEPGTKSLKLQVGPPVTDSCDVIDTNANVTKRQTFDELDRTSCIIYGTIARIQSEAAKLATDFETMETKMNLFGEIGEKKNIFDEQLSRLEENIDKLSRSGMSVTVDSA